ncbi:trypsin-like peptidase domain-containing protein [Bradyrhizobium sp. USDA 4529]
MAIIIPPQHGSSRIEGVILSAERPVFPIDGEAIEGVAFNSVWSEPLTSAADKLTRALRATARIETSDDALPFIGTAFAVTPTLAAVTGHIAQLMLKKREVGFDPVYRLNFYADESNAHASVGVKVRLIHPYFDFALLEMDRSVEAEYVLSFSPDVPEHGEDVALIGYPLSDPRNDPESVEGLFGKLFGKKRLMPGRVMSASAKGQAGGLEVPALLHDASCTSGTSGAPVVRLATGEVVGVHYAGSYLYRNYAVPAWELARDPFLQLSGLQFVGCPPAPSWLPLWKERLTFVDADVEGARRKSLLPNVPPAKTRAHLLTTDQINDLKDILVRAGFGSDLDIKDLFDGLPVELRAELPTATTGSAALLRCLRDLNRRTGLLDFEGRTPLHISLRAACAVKPTDAKLKAALEKYASLLAEHEEHLKRAPPPTEVDAIALSIPAAADFRRIATAIAGLAGKSISFIGLTEIELQAPVRKTQITFPSELEGLKMLRALAPRAGIRPYGVVESGNGFLLNVKEES